MFGSFLPSLWSSSNQSLLGSREPTLLCNQVPTNDSLWHPKQGIQGTWNQSLATGIEVGFLGSLCQGRLHLARATSQNQTYRGRMTPSCISTPRGRRSPP